jgi:hypothetical protein
MRRNRLIIKGRIMQEIKEISEEKFNKFLEYIISKIKDFSKDEGFENEDIFSLFLTMSSSCLARARLILFMEDIKMDNFFEEFIEKNNQLYETLKIFTLKMKAKNDAE